MKKALVSIVIPVFNAEKFLLETIKSVVEQSYESIEIIAIDDGSTDRSFEILSKFKEVQVIRQSNQGPAKARNVGVKLSKGEFIAFLDQDDIWEKDKISKQIDFLIKNTRIDFVLTLHSFFLDENAPTTIKTNFKKFGLENKSIESFSPSALLTRRETFEKTGLFNEDYPYYSEADWFLQAKEKGLNYYILNEVLLKKRFHQNNLSYLKEKTGADLLKIAHQSLQRKITLLKN